MRMHNPPHPGELVREAELTRDGELAAPNNFSSSSDQLDSTKTGVELVTLVEMIANIHDGEFIDPGKRLKGIIAGDWIIRADAPAEKVVASVGQILNRECRVPIQLKMEVVEETVIVVRGALKPESVPKAETILDQFIEATGGKAAYDKIHSEITSGSYSPTLGASASVAAG